MQILIPSWYTIKLVPYVSSVVILVATLLAIYIAHWVYRWRSPKCNGVLPPGSMGFPLIGETLYLMVSNASLDIPPFIKNRIQRYGPIFRTNLVGQPMIISADPELNHYLLRNDEKLVESWFMDTFDTLFDLRNFKRKYIRNLMLNHFGTESLRTKLLPQYEIMIRTTLAHWSKYESVEIKGEAIRMAIEFSGKEILSRDMENTFLSLGDMYRDMLQGIMCIPINFPGTTHHKILQIHKKIKKMMMDVVRKRMGETEIPNGNMDVLDHIIQNMKTEAFLNEDFIVLLMVALFFVFSESVSTVLSLTFKLLAENPLVVEELTVEHEAILNKRKTCSLNNSSTLSWDEYKSLRFTVQVTDEILRLGNGSPGFFRRALKDISYKGYTIPAGWIIMIATSGLHLNENIYEDPLKFNPWRWKEVEPSVATKCFLPFGSGMKLCSGAEFSRVFLASFLHVMVTKYRWSLVKGGKIVRSPMITFPDGLHFKISEK